MLNHEDFRFDTAEREGDTVGEIAYRRIRLHIVNGRLKPDEKLKLDHMKQVYGASVTTLREILNRLAVEELVAAEGQRGFRVAGVSDAELAALAELRILLETYALRRSIERGDLDWETRVVAAHYKLSSLEGMLMRDQSAAVEQWVASDWGFHYATISACDLPVLARTHASVFDRFARYHMLALDFRGKPAAKEHADLRDLVIGRKADAAVNLLSSHVRSGAAHITASGRFG
ncbi:DNA-binding transcriptional regulator, GntR family [Salinihabitans flavidus]|uniref:DNA-binding transcriptional regulator, GntR family n=1 Tax=Salinihabitans flavidus TaxID=569882 RepID=A0A1H8W3L5_9RHOB|nr:FCD domain-containing protein [Salinihabitans flavidus]SEP22225.1 DNA-binding transcriptional regulator, GntR family [Salinihabitans flavidus]